MAEITRSTDKVLCILYHIYLERRKLGSSYDAAVDFDYDIHSTNKKLSKIDESDFFHATVELNDIGYIQKYTDGSFELTSSAIADLENRFKNGAVEVLKFLTDLIP